MRFAQGCAPKPVALPTIPPSRTASRPSTAFRGGARRRMAEGEGFEPPEPCGSAVFKTAAIDHSATLPINDLCIYRPYQNRFIDIMLTNKQAFACICA